jgi:hypothetical protein
MWEYIPSICLHLEYSSRNNTYEIQVYYRFNVFYFQHYFYIILTHFPIYLGRCYGIKLWGDEGVNKI